MEGHGLPPPLLGPQHLSLLRANRGVMRGRRVLPDRQHDLDFALNRRPEGGRVQSGPVEGHRVVAGLAFVLEEPFRHGGQLAGVRVLLRHLSVDGADVSKLNIRRWRRLFRAVSNERWIDRVWRGLIGRPNRMANLEESEYGIGLCKFPINSRHSVYSKCTM